MNTMIQSILRTSDAQMPFQGSHLSAHANFILQSAEYFGLNISRDVAVILTNKATDVPAFQQADRH